MSWLKRGKTETSYTLRVAPSGSNSFAASRRAVLNDLLRPPPDIPSILMIGFSPFRVAGEAYRELDELVVVKS